MTIVNPKVEPRQVFSVRDTLEFNGFDVLNVEDKRDTLLPTLKWINPEAELVFNIFNDEEARNELYYRVLDENFHLSVYNVKELVRDENFLPEVQRYFTTFEWYIGELMIKNFGALSFSHGVSVKNAVRNKKESYYDLLVVLRNTNLMYFKSKVEDFTKESVFECINEGVSLYCEGTVMFTDPSIKDTKIMSMFKGSKHPFDENAEIKKIWVKDKPEIFIYEWSNFYFVNDDGDLKEKLRIIMRINATKKVSLLKNLLQDENNYPKFGFECKKIFG